MIRFKLFLMTIFFVLITISCEKNNEQDNVDIEEAVVIYIGANNNLHYDAVQTIAKIKEGAKNLKREHALLVYAKTQSISTLLKITNRSGQIEIDTLQEYIAGNSSDATFMGEIITAARNAAPAKKYGLVLWSHATSWVPPANVTTYSFGSDDFQEMDIREMKAVLPSDWEYIMFDACSMASIEVCYEFKDKAKYILASPAEVLSTSFPYDQILGDLFNGVNGLKHAASKFIEHYRKQSGLYASATVSLVETAYLSDIALHTASLLEARKPIHDFNRTAIQSLDFDNIGGVQVYDFVSFLKKNYAESEYSVVLESIEKSVLFKDHTSAFFNVPINEYCGLSIYLPDKNDYYATYYKTLFWSQASNWHYLF